MLDVRAAPEVHVQDFKATVVVCGPRTDERAVPSPFAFAGDVEMGDMVTDEIPQTVSDRRSFTLIGVGDVDDVLTQVAEGGTVNVPETRVAVNLHLRGDVCGLGSSKMVFQKNLHNWQWRVRISSHQRCRTEGNL
jgi:hypothetical protein